MWDTPFDESMLSAQPGVAIFCQEDSLAEELFDCHDNIPFHAGVYLRTI